MPEDIVGLRSGKIEDNSEIVKTSATKIEYLRGLIRPISGAKSAAVRASGSGEDLFR
jgi:hypothetical protein